MKSSLDIDGLAKALRESGVGSWRDEIYHRVFSRAGYRCEYCDFDLLSSLEAYVRFWDFDHILPKAKYQQLGGPRYDKYENTCTDFRNLALVCKACNALKRESHSWNCIIQPIATDITEEERDQLIVCVRDHIRKQRESKLVDYLSIKGIVERFDASRLPFEGNSDCA
jgi:hypothetical protein